MERNSALLRCSSCGTVNRVPTGKLSEHPKCGKCKASLEFPHTPVPVTGANFYNEVERWPGTVLVEFWSPRCGICKLVAPGIRELAQQRAGHLKVVLVNADAEWSLANRFSIQGVPVFILFRNGIKIGENRGGMRKYQLESWIDSALQRVTA